MFFQYDDTATDYLIQRDKVLGNVIPEIGHIYKETDEDAFSSMVHQIIAQQISNSAQATIWRRLKAMVGEINPRAILNSPVDALMTAGVSQKKAECIRNLAEKINSGAFDTSALLRVSQEEALDMLCKIKGIGPWTAEMILLFGLGCPDVLSFGDLGILKGLTLLYHHKSITPRLFEKYKKRFSPYGSIAGLYLWAVAGGALDGEYSYTYSSPIGEIIMVGNKAGLTWLSFKGKPSADEKEKALPPERLLPVFKDTVSWLDIYFSKKEPCFTPNFFLRGTSFQRAVWDALLSVPFGETLSYGDIAAKITPAGDMSSLLPRAVGQAVRRNPIALIVPCHRIVGSDGSLTGYAGGVERKRELLEMERW